MKRHFSLGAVFSTIVLSLISTVLAFTPSSSFFQKGIIRRQCSTTSQRLVAQAIETATTNVYSEKVNSAESVEFPPPLSDIDRLKRAAKFWSTAIPIVANYYGLIGELKLQEIFGDQATEEEIEVRKCSACIASKNHQRFSNCWQPKNDM
jgi:hypothetical protein